MTGSGRHAAAVQAGGCRVGYAVPQGLETKRHKPALLAAVDEAVVTVTFPGPNTVTRAPLRLQPLSHDVRIHSVG